jgi:hypothetical protein
MKRPKTHRWLPFYFWILLCGIGPTVYEIFKALNIAGSGGYIFFAFVLIAIRAITCWGIYTRKLWGWYLNFVALFGIPSLKALTVILYSGREYGEHAFSAGLLATSFFWLIYAVPNAIYFYKRKHLFDDSDGAHKTLFDGWRVLDPHVHPKPFRHPASSSQTTALKTSSTNFVPTEAPKTTPSTKVKRNRDIAESATLICGVTNKSIDEFIEFADFWEGDMENMNDEKFYEMAQNEIISGQAVQGLMLKAEIAAGGDEKKTRLIYLQARASQLYQEHLDEQRVQIAETKVAVPAWINFRDGKVRNCPSCGHPFNLNDYREDAEEIFCSACNTQLMKQAASLGQECNVLYETPDTLNCLKEAVVFREEDPGYSKKITRHYQKQSDSWLIDKLENPKKTTPKFYGLMLEEACRRRLNFSEITLKIPQ